MSTKYVTTKYGTRINVTGLTPDQVTKVLSTAQDHGAYGVKGTALAASFRKKNGATGQPSQPAPGDGSGAGNPDETGGLTGKGNFTNAQGFLDFLQQHLPGAQDLSGDVQKARDAAYSYSTQYNDQDKAKEVEDKKQELANRGIPYSEVPGSPYQLAMQNIDRKYQSMDDQAHNQAIQAGNSILNTESGVAQGSMSQIVTALLGMSDADLKKFGIDRTYLANMAAVNKKNSGGGGGGGGGGDTVSIGGGAPGFGV